MLGHGGSSAGLYLADPTSPIPSHCAVITLFQSVSVHQLSWLALQELKTFQDWRQKSFPWYSADVPLAYIHVEMTMCNISWYANTGKLTSVNKEQHHIFHVNVRDNFCIEG